LGNPQNVQIPLQVTYDVESQVATVRPTAPLQPGGRFELHTTPRVMDIGRNSLGQQLSKSFYTLMDPNVLNIIRDDDDITTLSVPPQSWGNGVTAGLAINGDPVNGPMAAPSISALITSANSNATRVYGAYGRPLVIQEFNLYGADGSRLTGMFKREMQLTMEYNDANNNGIVDETEGTSAPVRESALSLYWLDEQTGVWVRVPGSQVDTARNTVTAGIRHFSVYGIVGARAFDLTNARLYPVPYKASIHRSGITFADLSSVATIKIYTVSGELVTELKEEDGDGLLRWDPVVNNKGEPVASDVYIYIIENEQQKRVGKLVVVR
jgi:hypothetical protein